MRKKNEKSIIWTIDPWEQSPAHRKALVNFLQIFSENFSAKILPFSVVSPGGLDWPIPYTLTLAKDMKAAALAATKKNIEKLKVKNVLEPNIFVRASSGRRELVDSVISFAKKKKSPLIGVDTRSTVKKTVLRIGGFAEALITASPVPVLTVNPNVKNTKNISTIVFSTDFSKESHKAFLKVLGFAKKLRAKVLLVNIESELNQFELFAAINSGLAMNWIEEREREQIILRNRVAAKWQQSAKKTGVRMEFSHLTVAGDISNAILKFSRSKNADLIALASIHGPLTRAVLGSITKDVVLKAKVPVLVIRENNSK